MFQRTLCFVIASLAACGAPATSPHASSTPPTVVTPTEAVPSVPAPSPSVASERPAPELVRFTVDGVAYEARFGASPQLTLCASLDLPCVPRVVRTGVELRESWRIGLLRMADRARTEPCETEPLGSAVHLEIDGVAQDFVLAPQPDHLAYWPPEGDTYTECASRELARSTMIYLAWE